jgi:hypothetical protein
MQDVARHLAAKRTVAVAQFCSSSAGKDQHRALLSVAEQLLIADLPANAVVLDFEPRCGFWLYFNSIFTIFKI